MIDPTGPFISSYGHSKIPIDPQPDSLVEILLFCDKDLIGEKELGGMPNLMVLASPTTNDDHIDLTYCRKRGIEVVTLKGDTDFLWKITPTAEHTWGLIHAAHRRIPSAAKQVEGWNRWAHGTPSMLSKKTLVVIGRGRVGHKVCEIGHSLCDKVLYYTERPETASRECIRSIASKADILSIHVNWHTNNRNLIDNKVIEALPDGAIIINTAHGDALNIDNLIDHLDNGHLWGAGLDVLPGELDEEWPPQVRRAFSYAATHDNLIITPHIAGSTEDAWRSTQERVLKNAVQKWRDME